jgi:hypothetical protein
MIRVSRISVAGAALFTVVACSRLQEPGIPSGDSTPLFVGFKSYSTLDEIAPQLPARSSWEIISDSKIPARKDCPRFDEFMFAVPATHLGRTGRLRVEFINDRLRSTAFVPDDFPSYIEALRRSGLVFGPDGRATVPPHTEVWHFDREPRFVGWADRRFDEQARVWVSACS